MTQYGKRFDHFVDGVHGWYVPNGDHEAFGHQLAAITEMPHDELATIGDNGREFVTTHLSLDRAKRHFVELVERTLPR